MCAYCKTDDSWIWGLADFRCRVRGYVMLHGIVSQLSLLLRELAPHGARESGRQTDKQTRGRKEREHARQRERREAIEGESEGEAYTLLNLNTVINFQ